MSKLHSLRVVAADNCALSTAPDFSNSTQLRTLTLSNNKLASVPGLGNLHNLNILDLSSNRIQQSIGYSFSSHVYPNITTLNLAKNMFSSLPADAFDNMQSLTSIDLSYNQITDGYARAQRVSSTLKSLVTLADCPISLARMRSLQSRCSTTGASHSWCSI